MTVPGRRLKRVVTVKQAPPMHWVGDGFAVRSMFSYDASASLMSPFLLLDYAAPKTFPPSDEPRGVGAHPHRGFETVTIVYQGEIEHRDSAGHGGRIGPGDVQWMTAASGLVHEEKLGRDLTSKGGTVEMVQLWVNLPARVKMSPPRYQDLGDRQIPAVVLPDGAGTVRVIAGELAGSKGPALTFTPIDLWDVSLNAGRVFEASLPDRHTAALFLLHGRAEINEVLTLGEEEMVVLDRDAGLLRIEAQEPVRALLLAGEPIEEPVVGHGPFVMNTEEEVGQAFDDFRSGRMGESSL
jgi:redox-sensitive bicupin YhaK (pirin superfamily)